MSDARTAPSAPPRTRSTAPARSSFGAAASDARARRSPRTAVAAASGAAAPRAGAGVDARPRRSARVVRVGRARGRRLARALARAVPRQRADRAGQGLRRRRSAARRRRLPADEPEHDPRPRLRPARRGGPQEPGAIDERPEPLGLDHAAARRRRARTRGCRSRATRSSTSPATARQKINAAYAFGGAALAIRTVEQYPGIDVNHLIEVNFDDFPELIDAHGRHRLHGRLRRLARSTAATRTAA